MSILTELKKLTKKKNATVVSQALPDSLDGSGSGGGANVLTLYSNSIGGNGKAYKNPECTETYQNFNEAFAAMNNVDVIKVIDTLAGEGQYHAYIALEKFAVTDRVVTVSINITNPEANPMVDLWVNSPSLKHLETRT